MEAGLISIEDGLIYLEAGLISIESSGEHDVISQVLTIAIFTWRISYNL